VKVTFESGAWAEIRDAGQLTARDKATYTSAVSMPYDTSRTGGVVQFNMGIITRQLYTVLAALITSWSYDWILPCEDLSADQAGNLTYDASLLNVPVDDINELEEAVEPHMEKLRGGPKVIRSKVVTTGTSSVSSSREKAAVTRKG
jgi:hypothetical protein